MSIGSGESEARAFGRLPCRYAGSDRGSFLRLMLGLLSGPAAGSSRKRALPSRPQRNAAGLTFSILSTASFGIF
jgi:hypothetical protein